MKRELAGIKTDLASLMASVKALASTTATELASVKALSRNTAIAVAKLTGDVADMKGDMAANMATKDDVSLLMKRMDGFSDMLQDSRWDWGKQKVRLDEHEKRISRLEAKRA